MNVRACVIAVLLVAGGAVRFGLKTDQVLHAQSLDHLAFRLDEWMGSQATPLSGNVLNALGVDDHVYRTYRSSEALAGLYVGYYRSQSQGSTIHSPLNCLPGAGWQPMRIERVPFAGGSVNEVVIQKGEDRQFVLYWYQTATRVEGNEYWSKVHLVVDAFTSRRSDAALVRIVVPIDPRREDGEAWAARAAHRFATLIEPRVKAMLFEQSGESESQS